MLFDYQCYLGEVLVRRGVLSASRLESLLKEGGELDVRRLVVGAGAVSEEAVARALAEEAELPFLSSIDTDCVLFTVAARVPLSYARHRHLLVMSEGEASVRVAMVDPFDLASLDDLRALFGKPVEAYVAGFNTVREAIHLVYEKAELSAALLPVRAPGASCSDDDPVRDLVDGDPNDAPVIQWVHRVLTQAVRERASDVHIEPRVDGLIVRYRVDGKLRIAERAPKGAARPIIARIKIMSRLNIAEKRLPQSGRAVLVVAGVTVDARVETSPVGDGGESVVLRLLPKARALPSLDDLGLGARDNHLLQRLIARPHGMVLVTGPTGSGKTTTLSVCLDLLNTPERKILTAEDPIEYEIDGIHQTLVRPQIGLGFAAALRSFLRQDPDVIMVGEIRDKETASVAVSAAMTGHLVLSTVHTNDAAGAITRLADLGVDPLLIRSSLLGILAQRLVRVLCPHCKERIQPTASELAFLGVDEASWALTEVYKARGCDHCSGAGYRGRTGIYELMVMDDALVDLVSRHTDAVTLRRAAVEGGMTTLRTDGIRQILAGVTSMEEVLAVTQNSALFGEKQPCK